MTTSAVLTDLAAVLLRELIEVREVACMAEYASLPIRVSSTTGLSEQPLISGNPLSLGLAIRGKIKNPRRGASLERLF
jgi:hypothetical protein